MSTMTRPARAGIACALLSTALLAQGWPQFHGPHADRSAPGAIPNKAWPKKGPKLRWRKTLRDGFSSFAIAGKRAFTLVRDKDQEACAALDLASGRRIWTRRLGDAQYDRGGDAGTSDNRGGDGPRSTPSVVDGRVYIYDARLVLHCLDAKKGKPLWKRDIGEDHAGRNIRWQNATCPLVEGDAVFVGGGGEGQSLLAFHRKTGELLWKAFDEKITHATPVAATIHGIRQVIFYVKSGLLAVSPASGDELWRVRYPYRISSAASPVVHGELVFVSAGYGVGAACFEIEATRDGAAGKDGQPGQAGRGADEPPYLRPKLLWRKPNELMNHWSTPLAKDGHLYGMFSFKKYGKGPMKCVEMRSGETKWSTPGFGPGNCIRVGDMLVAVSDKGEVVLVEAKPESYSEIARHDVLDGKVWVDAGLRGRPHLRAQHARSGLHRRRSLNVPAAAQAAAARREAA